jgi:predicted O-methyltransferase YrrM
MNIIDFLKTLPHVEPNADYLNAPDYYPYLNSLARDFKAKRVLEVGVRFGYSAVALIYKNPVTEYVGIDFDLYDATSSTKSRKNLSCLKGFQPVDFTLFRKNTQELDDIAFLGPKNFDLVHIDGDHSYQGALTDLKNFWNVLTIGGHMLVDDSIFYGSVYNACIEFARLLKEPCYNVKTYRGTWVFLKTRERSFPIARSVNNERTSIKPIREEEVFTHFRAIHTGWSGIVTLLKDGTFRGGLHSPDGRWILAEGFLFLQWYHWPETKLKPDGMGNYFSVSSTDNLCLREYHSTKADVPVLSGRWKYPE